MNLKRVTDWLLPASLAINVFLGAVILTHHGHPGFRPPPPPNPAEMAARMADGLPPADAEILRQAFRAQESALSEAHRGIDSFHDRVRAALEAPVFDPQALTAALSDASRGHAAFDQAMTAAMVDAASRMSAEGRRRLASHDGPPGGPPPGGPPPPR